MISAPNLLLLSNGNRTLFIALLGFLLCGCDALRPAQGQTPSASAGKAQDNYLEEIQGTRVYDPVKQQWVVLPAPPRVKMDTLSFRVQPAHLTAVTAFPTNYPPNRTAAPVITPPLPTPAQTGGLPAIEKKDLYKIIVGLPFLASTAEGSADGAQGRVGRWALQFFAGMKMAKKILEEEQVRLNILVRDTKSDDSGMGNLLSSFEMRGADVFIGPYRRENIRQAAEQAQKDQFVLVSPYSAVAGLVASNRHYVQVNPSLESHCRALVRHARSEFAPEDILVIYRANQAAEKTCADFFQKGNAAMEGAMSPRPLTEMALTNTTYAGINIAPVLARKTQLAVIVPSWADQNFIFFLLRRIAEAKTPEQQVVVYGMPQWMEFQNFEYEFFEKLNVRISSSAFTDPLNPEVRAFRLAYFNEYGALPEMAAFEGYGLLLYVGRMLKEYGKNFQYYMDVAPQRHLHTRYEFQAIQEPDAGFSADRLNAISRFENTFVNILEFRDFQFQLLR